MLMMALSGVRSSCDTVARKLLLARVASSALASACCRSTMFADSCSFSSPTLLRIMLMRSASASESMATSSEAPICRLQLVRKLLGSTPSVLHK